MWIQKKGCPNGKVLLGVLKRKNFRKPHKEFRSNYIRIRSNGKFVIGSNKLENK